MSGALPMNRDYIVFGRSQLYTWLTIVSCAKCEEPEGCSQSAVDYEGNLGKVQR